jgi:hypothetical protein
MAAAGCPPHIVLRVRSPAGTFRIRRMIFDIPGQLVVAADAVATPANCAIRPVTGPSDCVMMSEANGISLGDKADADVRKEYGIYLRPGLRAYLNCVSQKLAEASHCPDLAYHFAAVSGAAINAAALPGGNVCVTRDIVPCLGTRGDSRTRRNNSTYCKEPRQFASLFRQSPVGENATGYRRLKDAYPRGEPVPGQMLRIVE